MNVTIMYVNLVTQGLYSLIVRFSLFNSRARFVGYPVINRILRLLMNIVLAFFTKIASGHQQHWLSCRGVLHCLLFGTFLSSFNSKVNRLDLIPLSCQPVSFSLSLLGLV